MSSTVPNEALILEYCAKIGVKNARITDEGLLGFHLRGEGRVKEKFYLSYPIVWKVAEDCGMSYGGGGSDWVQIHPSAFKHSITVKMQGD
jgi:hypothetical protein